jgi:hypothetical protein
MTTYRGLRNTTPHLQVRTCWVRKHTNLLDHYKQKDIKWRLQDRLNLDVHECIRKNKVGTLSEYLSNIVPILRNESAPSISFKKLETVANLIDNPMKLDNIKTMMTIDLKN